MEIGVTSLVDFIAMCTTLQELTSTGSVHYSTNQRTVINSRAWVQQVGTARVQASRIWWTTVFYQCLILAQSNRRKLV